MWFSQSWTCESIGLALIEYCEPRISLTEFVVLLYASGLSKVMAKHLREAHAYADDLQLYCSFELDSSNSHAEVSYQIDWGMYCRGSHLDGLSSAIN